MGSNGSPRKILVADDDPKLRQMFRELLGRKGYTVVLAEDGAQACESAAKELPDLILLDVLMPRCDGYSALLRLRSQESTRAIPVVFVSGEPPQEHTDIAKSLGAQGFLPKPFTLASLVSTIESVFNGAASSKGKVDA